MQQIDLTKFCEDARLKLYEDMTQDKIDLEWIKGHVHQCRTCLLSAMEIGEQIIENMPGMLKMALGPMMRSELQKLKTAVESTDGNS